MLTLSNRPGLIGDFVPRLDVGICGYWGNAVVAGQLILDHQLVKLGHIGQEEPLGKAVGVSGRGFFQGLEVVFNTDPIMRRFMDPRHQMAYWNEHSEGGRFAAMEAHKTLS
jgi:hypothetical protein